MATTFKTPLIDNLPWTATTLEDYQFLFGEKQGAEMFANRVEGVSYVTVTHIDHPTSTIWLSNPVRKPVE